MKLTLKQEKFCNELLATGSQAAAYRNSYRTEFMKPGTIHTAALELMRNPNMGAFKQTTPKFHRIY